MLYSICIWLVVSKSVHAESTRFFNLEGFGQFLDGDPESTAVTEEGSIILPAVVRERYFDPSANYVAATNMGDDVVVAQADSGQVLLIDRSGKTSTLFKPLEGLVTALMAFNGELLVATGPKAKIYAVDRKGRNRVVYTGEAAFIWEMVESPEHDIWMVTGNPGHVIRLNKSWTSQVMFVSRQDNLRCIAVDKDWGILVGGGSRGIVYWAKDRKTFHALYDTGQEEIIDLQVVGEQVFVAGVSGADMSISGKQKEDKKDTTKVDVRSQIIRLQKDGGTEVVAGSNDEVVWALGLNEKQEVVVATGSVGKDRLNGRLYTIEPKQRRIAMVYQTPSRRFTHLVHLANGAIAAIAASGGRIVQMTSGFSNSGVFLTSPFDAGINAQLGMVSVVANIPKGTKVNSAVRSGQTATPDDMWSAWSQDLNLNQKEAIKVPNGRFFQIRLTLFGDGSATPEVQRVRLAYLRQNLPPYIREVVALRKGFALYKTPKTDNKKSQSVALDKKANKEQLVVDEDNDHENDPGTARQIEENGALTIKWLAEDPNGDILSYDLYFRVVGEKTWALLKSKLADPFYSFVAAQLPDGYYQFQIIASDELSNTSGLGLTDTKESQLVLIDNTPPTIEPLTIKMAKTSVVIKTTATDTMGPLVNAEYSLDGGEFKMLNAEDGILDEPTETFAWQVQDLAKGFHILTFRIFDGDQNESSAQIRWTQ